MTRTRLQALRYSNDDVEAITELVALHLRFHGYETGWTDSAVRRYVRRRRPAPHRAERAHPLRLHDPQRDARLRCCSRRMDDLEVRIAELQAKEELKAIRPELDGKRRDGPPRPRAGPARRAGDEVPARDPHSSEGLVGDDEVRRRLDEWWAKQCDA